MAKSMLIVAIEKSSAIKFFGMTLDTGKVIVSYNGVDAYIDNGSDYVMTVEVFEGLVNEHLSGDSLGANFSYLKKANVMDLKKSGNVNLLDAQFCEESEWKSTVFDTMRGFAMLVISGGSKALTEWLNNIEIPKASAWSW